jgi:hypothetical protein
MNKSNQIIEPKKIPFWKDCVYQIGAGGSAGKKHSFLHF